MIIHCTVLRPRAERHANPDFAGAPRDRVGFHAVDANDGERQGETAEEREQGGAGAHDPELHIGVEMLRKRLERKHGQSGIGFTDRATNGVGQGTVVLFNDVN